MADAPFRRPVFGEALHILLTAYVAELARRTGLPAKLEPVPVDTRAASLEVVPQAIRIERDGESRWEGADEGTVFRAELPHLIVLTGKGTGPGFVAECFEASLRAELVLNGIINVPWTGVEAGRFASAQITPRREGEGRFFEADEEGGPQLYERSWDGVLILPLGTATVVTGLLPGFSLT